ncbi:hypothetical protein ACMCNP_08295 [Candidatus Acidulodesulfobacterium sp. H_13]|uniref:hypothetical protein n=1 Tax=Candidatus Acidulodesulfobacterium sp. H_13 TaxID=3395470 RepID=UPI003AF87C42
MEILDMKCAEYGSRIASIEGINEALITKVLGVLREDGVYAFFLYRSSLKKDQHIAIKNQAFDFLKQDAILGHVFGTETDVLTGIREKLSDKLDELFFAKEILERTLVYARYHAKTLEDSSNSGGA